MKKFIATLKNIWAIDELRQKITITLLFLLVYRFGTHVVLPGLNPNSEAFNKAASKGAGGLLGLFDTFAGGAFSQASIFALGIMPYISASIAVQLLTIVVPQFQKMSKEGESGRRQLNQWTRILTVIVTAFQGFAYVRYLNTQDGAAIVIPTWLFTLSTVTVLTTCLLYTSDAADE